VVKGTGPGRNYGGGPRKKKWAVLFPQGVQDDGLLLLPFGRGEKDKESKGKRKIP